MFTGKEWTVPAWHGVEPQDRQGTARLGKARQGIAGKERRGRAWHGAASPGMETQARHGADGRGKSRHGNAGKEH